MPFVIGFSLFNKILLLLLSIIFFSFSLSYISLFKSLLIKNDISLLSYKFLEFIKFNKFSLTNFCLKLFVQPLNIKSTEFCKSNSGKIYNSDNLFKKSNWFFIWSNNAKKLVNV